MDKVLRFLFIVLFNISFSVLGLSNDSMQDLLFLENGEKNRNFINHMDFVNIEMLTTCDDLTIIGNNDIVHRGRQALGNMTLLNEPRFKPKGFQSQIEGMFGGSTLKRINTGVRFLNDYKFKNRYFIGIGIGANITPNYYGNIFYSQYITYPLFLRLSTDLWIKKTTPYLFTDFGSQFENSSYEKLLKPLFFRFGVGSKLITKRSILYSSIAYSFNKVRSLYIYQSKQGYSDWYRNHNVEIGLGIQFN